MTTIKLKNGSGAPTAGDLVQGEPALDLTNKRLYTEDSGGTVIEVGTNPTSITTGDITATGTVTFAGLGTTSDVTFGDNNKAIFGAGSDLQIYHDGTYNFINAASGQFIFMQADELRLRSSTGETYLAATLNGATTLYHDASAKLATTSTGIDVTGTVTADSATIEGGLTVSSTFPTITFTDTDSNPDYQLRSANGYFQVYDSTNTAPRLLVDNGGDTSFYNSAGTSQDLYWDASTSRLGLGETSPAHEIHIKSDSPQIRLEDDGGTNTYGDLQYNGVSLNVISRGGASAYGAITFARTDGTDTFNTAQINAAGDYRFFDDTGTEAMRWDASTSRLGLGTTSPGTTLHLSNSDPRITLTDTDAGGNFQIRNTSGVAYISTLGAHPMLFSTNSAEAMRIDSDGNVGISNSSPSYDLHIGDGSGDVTLALQSDDSGETRINLGDASNAAAGHIVYDNSVNRFTFQRGGANAYEVDGTHTWYTVGGSRAMDLDSSGNLLVGTTVVAGAQGLTVRPNITEGAAQIRFNRATTTATSYVMVFADQGTDVGSISHTNTATAYNTSSDQRLKENIVDAPSASDDIDAIQVRSFDWKADGSHQKYGMVAQELQTVAPEAVTEGDTEEDMMGVDYSKLVPMLVKEIQSLRARVAQLEGAN